MRPKQELRPLRTVILDRKAAEEARAVERLEQAWHLIVGPALVWQTRPLRIHRQTLIMGCWNTEVMSSLRQSAEMTWPQVQARLERFFHLKLNRLEIVPCDPPEPRSSKPLLEDPLKEVLQKLRSLGNEGWTRGRK